MSPPERRAHPVGPEETIPAIFGRRARETPDAVAVSCAGAALTYAELDAAADRLAHRLRSRGVAPDEPVGVCLERGTEPGGGAARRAQGRRLLPAARPRAARRAAGLHRGRLPGGRRGRRRRRGPRAAARPRGERAAAGRRPARHRPRRRGARHGLGRQPGLRHLHLRLHRASQGRRRHPRQRAAAAALLPGRLRLRAGRRVDALPLRHLRLLGLGAVGRAAARRPGRGRAAGGGPLAEGLPRPPGRRAGDRAQPDPVRLPRAERGRRRGGPAAGPTGPAGRGVRRRGAGRRRTAVLGRTGSATTARRW